MFVSVRRIVAFCALGMLVLAPAGAAFAQTSGKLVVFAAASLATALNAIQPIFVQAKGQAVAISYGYYDLCH